MNSQATRSFIAGRPVECAGLGRLPTKTGRDGRREMFGILGDLTKAVVGVVVETPLAVAADVLTLGGAITDKDEVTGHCAERRGMRTLERDEAGMMDLPANVEVTGAEPALSAERPR